MRAVPLPGMPEHTNGTRPALEEFVHELLECGAVLSQIVSHMVRFGAAGLSSPDAAPVPVVAHKLISDALTDVKRRRSRRDLKMAAAIVRDATEAMCENLFFVDVEEAKRITGSPGDPTE